MQCIQFDGSIDSDKSRAALQEKLKREISPDDWVCRDCKGVHHIVKADEFKERFIKSNK